MMSFKWLLPVACLVFPSKLTTQASSAADYSARHYDRRIHFTPDGRLLQVEYAAAASDNSSPLVVCQLDQDTMVVMTCSPANKGRPQQQQRSRQKPQDRLVVVEDTVVVAMSGVLSDSLALLKSALQEWEEYKIVFGDQDRESVMLSKFANAMGEACHHNCFQGGVRPYGSTMLLLGMDIPTNDNANQHVRDHSPQYPFRILQTDPSGGVTPIPVFRAVQQPSTLSLPSSINVLKIVGGNPDLQKKLHKAIQKLEDDRSPSKKDQRHTKAPAIWEQLSSLASILMDAQQEQSNPSSSSTSFFGFKKRKRPTSTSIEKKGDTSNNPPHSSMFKVEIVILSRKLGIYRLPEEQTEQLLHEVQHEDSS